MKAADGSRNKHSLKETETPRETGPLRTPAAFLFSDIRLLRAVPEDFCERCDIGGHNFFIVSGRRIGRTGSQGSSEMSPAPASRASDRATRSGNCGSVTTIQRFFPAFIFFTRAPSAAAEGGSSASSCRTPITLSPASWKNQERASCCRMKSTPEPDFPSFATSSPSLFSRPSSSLPVARRTAASPGAREASPSAIFFTITAARAGLEK